MENGEFEDLEITPYSSPPDLPDVMKNQEAANGQETVAWLTGRASQNPLSIAENILIT